MTNLNRWQHFKLIQYFRYDCRALNLTWINAKITFDHVGHAYLALFQVVSILNCFDCLNTF